jgi:hypothetical protein
MTEIRAHLFDGAWSENIGSAGMNAELHFIPLVLYTSSYCKPFTCISCFSTDFMAFFNADGSYVYPKAVDVDIKAPGPCLSNTTFSHVS